MLRWILVVMVISSSATLPEDSEGIGKFVPTSEWSEIKPGQSIGKGLHVRMNLETGLKEAKFLIETDSDMGNSKMVVSGQAVSEAGLKQLVDSQDNTDTVSKKFRSIEELKRAMPDVKLQTMGQVLQDKMKLLNSTADADIPSLVILLEEIQDLAHNFDNGKLLVTQGWIAKIGALLEHPNTEVYKAALRVLASAAQSNPTVQIYCIEHGYLATLISQLLSLPEALSKSTVFTISAIVRNVGGGTGALVAIHGYNTLTTKLGLSSLAHLQRGILNLYNDLLQQDTQLGAGDVLAALKPGSKVLCGKLPVLLGASDVTSDVTNDVIMEAVRLLDRTRHWCDGNTNEKIDERLEELLSLFQSRDEEVYNIISSALTK